jgi:hypothetical protein
MSAILDDYHHTDDDRFIIEEPFIVDNISGSNDIEAGV